ncbi:MAG: hypothetical protein JSR68_08240 [Proteobacteria bacterium]|nr:hypothetical protein [Pseudomonadota bacterium]
MNARDKSPAAKAATQTEQAAGQPAAPAARAATAAAVVQPAPAAQSPAPAPDEHAGRGGLYVMRDGRRELVERTQSPE